MPSPVRSRDEATAYSPLRNAFASSSTPKPLHSPFLPRNRLRPNESYTRLTPQPDAISTSSSTLVNAESTDGYQPWEVRSESSASSLDSLGSGATPTLQTLDDIGTLPSIHITPLSEPRSQGRDFEKDPVLVPRSARSRSSIGRSPTSPYQRSYDQLQRGLDTLELDESDAESDAEQALAAQRRAESMARWTARRSTLLQSKSPASKLDTSLDPASSKPSPMRSTPRSLTSDASPKPSDASATPLKATPGRRSIAAVFESMQKEREARAAEEQKQWADKQAKRERERAARAFGVLGRRRLSVDSSQMDSPKSIGSSAFATPASVGGTTVFQSMRETPSRSTGGSAFSGSPMLSSLGSAKVDEEGDARSLQLNEEHAQPQQLSKEAAEASETVEPDEVSADDVDPIPAATTSPPIEDPQSQPPAQHAPGFTYSPQPMALSPNRSDPSSAASTPASSPRKNAHRRQVSTLSVVSRTPARQLDHLIAQDSPHTPSGILSSAKKGSARRGHSVRFSPRPDYRSDSGSWDESAVLGEGEGGGLLPAKEIVLPAILAEASTPALTAAEQEDEEASREGSPIPQTPSPQSVGEQHTPSPPPPLPIVEATTSFSHTLHPPGAYASPLKPSRHIIRPSPKITRVLPASLTTAGAPLRGLFADSHSALPRSSTPPPQLKRSTTPPMLPPAPALRSPRSPRPVDLGLEGFAPFSPGSSDDSAGSVRGTLSEMLTTLQAGDRGRREFGARLGEAARQLERVRSSPPVVRSGETQPWERFEDADERDRVAQLREEVMAALSVLAERLSHPPPTTVQKRLGRGQKLLLVLLQCALIAYLLSLAERKAAHLRMFHPPTSLHYQGEIDWSTMPTTTLQPVLRLPLLDQLWRLNPPLPARVAEWKTYSAVNGVPQLLAQVAIYGVSQATACIVLLALAPLQVLWLVIHSPTAM
ncbi:hypothetical protein PSEUBRA_004517 [Kalmanozyma brasiliensis GHG001]|nr:uncharacterized protein PSEUBRA_004517 [Kalmanozyma brasiliensis GHG001]EST06605.2 hypothetical protein PSEUBRA_004517 [Kalmanozyma brasiliensis GHG001]